MIDGLNNGYAYDAEGRIAGMGSYVAGSNGTYTFTPNYTYTYDAEGNRVGKTGGADQIYFGGREIARLQNGQWTDLIYGAGGLLAEVPGTQTGAPVYRMLDQLGTQVGTLDANGVLLSLTDYASFGQVFAGGSTDPYKFTGKERDTESGNDHFSARYYASSMGRFMSPDWSEGPAAVPYANMSNPQSLNLYAYVLNNPLTGVDSDGHFKNGLLDPNWHLPLPEPWICFSCMTFDMGAWRQRHPTLSYILFGPPCPNCQLGMIPVGPGGELAAAGSILAGFSSDELVIANELIAQGSTVVKVEESTVSGVKTADALVNGVKTEFKTVTASGETSVKNAIETASKQNTQNILVNARNSNLTAAQVQQQIARAQGNVGGLTGRVTVWTKEGTVRF